MNLSDELSFKIYDQIIEAIKSNNCCSRDSFPISNQYIANDIFLYKDEDVIVDTGCGSNGEYL